MNQYVYIIQEREFIRLNEQTYKIGKTKRKALDRIKDYPKGSELKLYLSCYNCDILEKEIINVFDIKFLHKSEYGREYYEGDLNEMIKEVFLIKKEIEQMGINYKDSRRYIASQSNK